MIYTALTDIWSAFNEFNSSAALYGFSFAILYCVIIIIHNAYNAKKGKPHLRARIILAKFLLSVLFGIYISYTVSLTLSGREAGSRSGYYNLVPGTTIFNGSGVSIFAIENLLLFIPMGFFLPAIVSKCRNIITTSVISLILSLIIEITQLSTNRGFFETDDIILNTFGGILGYFFFSCMYDSFLGMKRRIINDAVKNGSAITLPQQISARFALNNDWALIILQIMPIAILVKIIMGFSSEVGSASRNWSRPIAIIFAKISSLIPGSFGLSDIPASGNISSLMNIESVYLDVIEKIVRKIAHMTEYALLALFVFLLVFSRTYIKRHYSYIAGVVIVLIVALFDEFNQKNIPGRFGSLRDVLIDLLGAVIMLLIIRLIVKKFTRAYQ